MIIYTMQKYNDRLTNLVQHVPGLPKSELLATNDRPSVLGSSVERSGYTHPAKDLQATMSIDPNDKFLELFDTYELDKKPDVKQQLPENLKMYDLLIRDPNVDEAQDVLHLAEEVKQKDLIEGLQHYYISGTFPSKRSQEFWSFLNKYGLMPTKDQAEPVFNYWRERHNIKAMNKQINTERMDKDEGLRTQRALNRQRRANANIQPVNLNNIFQGMNVRGRGRGRGGAFEAP